MTVILGGIYTVFQTTTRNLRAVEEEGELTQTARVVLSQLRRELGSVYPMRIPVSEEDRAKLGDSVPEEGLVSFAGEDAEGPDGQPRDNLRFTAVVASDKPGARQGFDLAELMYQIDDDTDTPESGLVRRSNHHPGLSVSEDEPPELLPLTPLATALNVRYFVGDQTDETGALPAGTDDGWVDGWSDPDRLPSAIEITLGLTPDRPDAVERRFRAILCVPIRTPRPDPQKLNESTQTGGEAGPAEPGAGATPGPGAVPGAGGVPDAAAGNGFSLMQPGVAGGGLGGPGGFGGAGGAGGVGGGGNRATH
ncbi:MAG: hypothetical protein HYU66_18435 [Armatimonadetes bacterium]|nr:hypothetical protein [Armatimonadota bacterium]